MIAMDRNFLLITVVGISILNGLFSPFLVIAMPIAAVLMPEVFPRSVGWVLFFSSLLVASGTLLFPASRRHCTSAWSLAPAAAKPPCGSGSPARCCWHCRRCVTSGSEACTLKDRLERTVGLLLGDALSSSPVEPVILDCSSVENAALAILA
jgi:hypothetical protein